MITGIFLKNYKIYKKTHLVPISVGHALSAFVGANGAGKSSVLEALDTYFNSAQWIVNKVARQAGETTNFINYPYVCPIFVLPKADFQRAHEDARNPCPVEVVEKISKFLWTVEHGQGKTAAQSSAFIQHRDQLARHFAPEDHYLLVLGIRYSPSKDISPTYFGPFHAQASFIAALGLSPAEDSKQLDRAKRNDANIGKLVGDLNATIRSIYDYVYMPSSVNIVDITRLERRTMQTLMRRDIDAEIRKAIDRNTLRKINESLEQTIEAAVSGLPEYTYDKPTGGKKSITHPSLCKLITLEFFSIRELCRIEGSGPPTPVSHLSSGEQRRALIDVATNYLMSGSDEHKYTVLAIDEPEISLHTSRCFDQFEDLFDVARRGVQTIMTTHWYGFLPIAQQGNAHFFDPGTDDRVQVDSYDLQNYREAAKHRTESSRGSLPFDLALKSANDLVQSIASSLRLSEPYSWILCEGSSETVYLSYMLEMWLEKTHLRILALGGAPEVKRIYHHLEVALSDKTFQTQGRVLALIDTDEQIVHHEPDPSVKPLSFLRLLLGRSGPLQLVPVNSKVVSPATAIEDALNPKCFVETLREFGGDLEFSIGDAVVADAPASGRALDLKDSEKQNLARFFAQAGMKLRFAEHYVRIARARKIEEPLLTQEPLLTLLEKYLPAPMVLGSAARQRRRTT